jgi:hypothetical protein
MAPDRWPHARAPAARPRTDGPSSAADVGHVRRPMRPYALPLVAVEDFSPTPAPPRAVSPPPFLCHRSVPYHHRPPPSRHRPPTRSVDAAPMTARVPTTFRSHEPPTSTTGRHPHRSIPLPLLRLCRARHVGELLHPSLLYSVHHGSITLLPPSPFFLAQEHRKELEAATSPLLCPPRHPSPVRASLPTPFSNPCRWQLRPTSLVISPPDRKHERSSYVGTARAAGEPIAAPDAPSPCELPTVVWVPDECVRRC